MRQLFEKLGGCDAFGNLSRSEVKGLRDRFVVTLAKRQHCALKERRLPARAFRHGPPQTKKRKKDPALRRGEEAGLLGERRGPQKLYARAAARFPLPAVALP